MINIMSHRKNWLKVSEFEDCFTTNSVQVEDDGLIDPYMGTNNGEPGKSDAEGHGD